MPEVPHLNGLTPTDEIPTFYNVSLERVKEVLNKKKGRSSPGPSGMRYEHLKHVLAARPEFLRTMINYELNSTTAPTHWEHCTVIPLYKLNKMGAVTDPGAFRSVMLQEASMKLVESVWVAENLEKIEGLIGPEQNAYKTKHGVYTALYRMAQIMWKRKCTRGGGFIFFFDVKRAFGSSDRGRLFVDLIAKFPGDTFIKKLNNCYNVLKMKVDLGFCSVDDVDYLRGLPEGSCTSAYLFVIMMKSVVDYVLRFCPFADLDLYSDDIACIASAVEELQEVFTRISEALAHFDMKFDYGKSEFIRFGDCSTENITLVDPAGTEWHFRYSSEVRYLGFHLRDGQGTDCRVIDIDFHLDHRATAQSTGYEILTLKWIANNYYFANRVKRAILLTRTIPKMFFGIQAVIYCTNFRLFSIQFLEYDENNKKRLKDGWHEWDKMDSINKRVGKFAKALTKGMTDGGLSAAFYYIKPLHVIGMPSKMQDVRSYWLRSLDPRWAAVKKFFIKYTYIINGINFRKGRLPNTHLLTAIFCGHFSKFTSTLYYTKSKEQGDWKCALCGSLYDESCYTRTGPCACDLAIPGVVPNGRPVQPQHWEFIRYLNKLASHESFEMFKKDKPYPMDNEVTTANEFEYDGTLGCLYAFTDGSYDKGRAGWGVYYEAYPGVAMNSALFGSDSGKQSNNTAELSAILMALRNAKGKFAGPIRIHTDSQYSISALTMFRRSYEKDLEEEEKIKGSVLNLELIRTIFGYIYNYGFPVFISKVKAHADCEGNNVADYFSSFLTSYISTDLIKYPRRE